MNDLDETGLEAETQALGAGGEGREERTARLLPLSAVAIVVAALVVGGCGAHTHATASVAEPAAGKVSERGIKGESTGEVASDAHISGADCARLKSATEGLLGRPLSHRSTPRPPASRCELSGHGASVNVYLDAGFAAHQRYYNRIEETVQFGETDPARDPHPVPHVGERAIDDSAANWIPALGSLLAVRGNRWLTVTIAVPGRPAHRLRDDAASLARLGFRLTVE